MKRWIAACALVATAAAAQTTAPPKENFVALEGPLLALTHVEVFDGTGAAPLKDATILVRDGRIAAFGAFADVKVPAEAKVVDLSGHSITPGLVMLHEHMFYPLVQGSYGAMFETFPKLYLAGGATTVRTGGSMSPYADINVAHEIAEGKRPGPDMDVTAPFLDGPSPFLQDFRIRSPEQAREMVRYWASAGATSYKGYMSLSRAQLGAIVDEAHKGKRKVTAHLCGVTYREAADLGIDNLEHGFLASTDFVKDKKPDECPNPLAARASFDTLAVDAPEMKALQKHLIERKVALTSTLTVFETFASGRPIAPPEALELLIPQLRESYVARWSQIQAMKDNVWTRILPKEMAWEKQFVEAGGLLVAGTDPTGYGGVVPGFSNVRQVELLEEAGFTRAQALRIGTLNGAIYLGRDKDIGSIAAGKRADLVLYKGSLSTDPAALRQIVWTMKAGTAYDSKKLLASLKGKVGFQ